MKKIDLTADADSGEAAFDPTKIEDFGLDGATLCDLLAYRIRPYASMLRDGCGFGIMVTDGQVSIFGLKNAADQTNREQRQRCLHSLPGPSPSSLGFALVWPATSENLAVSHRPALFGPRT